MQSSNQDHEYERDLAAMARVFRALSNVHRLKMYETLFSGGISTCCDRIEKCEPAVSQTDVVRMLGLSQSTISHYLRLLEEAGLVTVERRGPWTCYFPDYEQAARIGAYFGSLAASKALATVPPNNAERP